MLSVKISLDRILCRFANFDHHGYSVDPYLWTVFFHVDMNTINMGLSTHKIVVTETPDSNFTTRGMYPDNVSEGDEIGIPWDLGKHHFLLDDGGLGRAAVGALFVLLAQAHTPGDAISAGHRALAEATNAALNNYVWARLPDVGEPTAADIQQMANQIQGEVTGAVKDAQSLIDILRAQDSFLGFGYIFMSFAELSSLAARQPPERLGFNRYISRRFTINLLGDEKEVEYSFRIAGGVSAVQHTPRSAFQQELDSYNATVSALNVIDDKINRAREQLHGKSGEERAARRSEMDELLQVARPQAVGELAMARAAFDQRRDSTSTTSRDYLAVQEALQNAREDRLARQGTSQFHEQAVIASMKEPAAPEPARSRGRGRYPDVLSTAAGEASDASTLPCTLPWQEPDMTDSARDEPGGPS